MGNVILQQRWPQIQSVYYDPTKPTKTAIILPNPPIDGQLVITVNTMDEYGATVVKPAVSTTDIIDPVRLTRDRQADITGSFVAVWWQYRAEDNCWYPVAGMNTDRSQSIAVLNDDEFLGVDHHTVEVISPCTIGLPPVANLHQRLQVKNSCPDSGDVVNVRGLQTDINVMKFYEDFLVYSLELTQGQTLSLQSFGSYWLVLSLADYLAPSAWVSHAMGSLGMSTSVDGTATV